MGRIEAPIVFEPDWAMRYPGDLAESDDRMPEGRRLIDIGSGVLIAPVSQAGEGDATVGLFVLHQHEDGRLCEGFVGLDVPENRERRGPVWQVILWEPLTLSPSILRTDCGLHGWITDGRWVGC